MSNQQRQNPRSRRPYSQQQREARWRLCTDAWLSNIQRATAVMHNNNNKHHHPNGFARDDEEHHGDQEDHSDAAMRYLKTMETRLYYMEQNWDKPPLSLPPPSKLFAKKVARSNTTPPMEMRRILIRVVNAQSELLAYQASQCRLKKPRPFWSQGAELYGSSLDRIHCALDLADSQCVRELVDDADALEPVPQEDGAYQTDASIVEVAIAYLTDERVKYHKAALKQLDKLQRKLQPQWHARDEAKAKLGDRWYDNPRPKNEFVNRRRQDEAELKDVQEALVLLSSQSEHKVSKKKQRCNGIRPSVRAKRVVGYADPAHFGWRFTGSWNNYVEFWVRDGCRMDWYFSTGTVKTSLHHPTQGKTQLFGSRVTPEVFQKVLENPRAHTNVRYQRKENKPTSTTENGDQDGAWIM